MQAKHFEINISICCHRCEDWVWKTYTNFIFSSHSPPSPPLPALPCLDGFPARHYCHVTRTSSCQLHGELNVSSERWLMWRVTSREHHAAATPPPHRVMAPLHHWLHQPKARALATLSDITERNKLCLHTFNSFIVALASRTSCE